MNAASSTKRGLGRGLNALFEDEETPAFAAPAVAATPEEPGVPRKTISVAMLRPGKFQPRQQFDDATLKELAESITAHGILQPLLVRPLKGQDGQYEIICGERRWRAAQKAQLHNVPVVIREMDDEQAMQMALIENLQREDLNPLDEAEGYQRLMEEFAHTQDKLALAVGKSRSHVSNMIRLLSLPGSVRSMIRSGKLSAGHGRALITAKNPEALAHDVIARGLSVRDTERLAQNSEAKPGVARKTKPPKDVDTLGLEREMLHRLGMKVTIDLKNDGKSGALKIDFKDFDQLDKLIQKLS
ncbi:MAG: ParB/RepB/Spo0J family partition protein [Micavibrio aeruginosavorus]|nr:ParB/RepB/Spo0J family partition protein [Micavibrio aeruginosavorus]